MLKVIRQADQVLFIDDSEMNILDEMEQATVYVDKITTRFDQANTSFTKIESDPSYDRDTADYRLITKKFLASLDRLSEKCFEIDTRKSAV